MAYQPSSSLSQNAGHLQQQKLKWLISPNRKRGTARLSTIVEIKMAYQPVQLHQKEAQSTIVEIKMAYQPNQYQLQPIESTIVEIKMAYQPAKWKTPRTAESTIVEIKMAYQPI